LSTRRFADLKTRILSAAVAAALGLTLIWLGGIWTLLLVMLVTGVMAWEWRSITQHRGGTCGIDAVPMIAAVVAGAAAGHVWSWATGVAVLGMGLAVALATDIGGEGRRSAGWNLLGGAYLGAAGIAFLYMRADGFAAALWLFLVVAAADVGGYFAGRLIGGPKLWPRVSPKKTWAGCLGGVALAVAVGAVFSAASSGTFLREVCMVSGAAALVSQAGDLAESALKRHFGVKDSGALLPGHGGALDRFDGLVAAAIVAALASWWRGGTVFVW
jgi:phosphatidate cytidylyltransferase